MAAASVTDLFGWLLAGGCGPTRDWAGLGAMSTDEWPTHRCLERARKKMAHGPRGHELLHHFFSFFSFLLLFLKFDLLWLQGSQVLHFCFVFMFENDMLQQFAKLKQKSNFEHKKRIS